jgi:ABC-type multidrug transport system fused ATPase/permease subunit
MSDNSGSSNFFGKILEGLRIYPKEAKNAVRQEEKQRKLTNFESLEQMQKMNKSMFTSSQSRLLEHNPTMVNVLKKWMINQIDRKRGKHFKVESDIIIENAKNTLKQILLIGGTFKFILLAFVFFITNASLISIQVWIALWSTSFFDFDYNKSFTIFVLIFFFVCLWVVGRQMLYSGLIVHNLTKLYIKSIKNLLAARDSYFDRNPSTRIVYLLTKDQMIVDNDLVRSFFIVLDACLIILIIILTLNYFFYGIMLLLTILLTWLAYSLYKRFIRVAQRLSAFVTASRAKMFDVYLELYDNITMLRDIQKIDYFTEDFYTLTDEYQVATTTLNNHSMRWLNFRISLFSVFAIFCILGIPLVSRMYLKGVYLTEKWELSYVVGTGPFLLAAIINFSKYLPKMTIELLSAQRIFHYMLELTVQEEKQNRRRNKDSYLKVPKPITNLIKREKTQPKV